MRSGVSPRTVASMRSRSVIGVLALYYTRVADNEPRAYPQSGPSPGRSSPCCSRDRWSITWTAPVLGMVMPLIRRDLALTNQEYGWA